MGSAGSMCGGLTAGRTFVFEEMVGNEVAEGSRGWVTPGLLNHGRGSPFIVRAGDAIGSVLKSSSAVRRRNWGP